MEDKQIRISVGSNLDLVFLLIMTKGKKTTKWQRNSYKQFQLVIGKLIQGQNKILFKHAFEI